MIALSRTPRGPEIEVTGVREKYREGRNLN